ncbi:MAG TPA: zf-HC2 domain-containing protein [Candidatus Acidoferrales bacterium]|jgi:anti-sigma factor RsiW|nr:zf-HC2 domain-containing protein [Candidatus Acidoferrales bacterium]
MSLFDQPCRQHRRDVSLLAAGALPPAERDAVAQHLSACPACREYFAQIKAVTTPLAAWTERLPQVEPSLAAQQRWLRAIRAADQPAPVHGVSPFQVLWQKLILPSRRTWAGLATVWVLLIAINIVLRGQSSATAGKPVTLAAMISYGDQQKLLNELFADRSPTVDADRPKNYSPKPRTEKAQFFTA